VHDALEIRACGGVSEHDRSELRAVDRSVSRQHVGAEARRDGGRRFRPGSDDAVRQFVGVQRRNPARPQLLEHVALPGRDPAGQRDSKHAPPILPIQPIQPIQP
jgi:hypothetical protein